MLSKQQKRELVKQLAEELKQSKTAVVCGYGGLTVAEMAEIRKKLREQQATMKVIKKSLTEIAFKEAGIELKVRELEGQTAVVFGGEDEVAIPKTLAEIAKKTKKVEMLKGTLEGKIIDQTELMALAKLPTKEELLAKTVGMIKAPITGFVSVISGNLRNLVGVLEAIRRQKEETVS